jgi:hypothetical protein
MLLPLLLLFPGKVLLSLHHAVVLLLLVGLSAYLSNAEEG